MTGLHRSNATRCSLTAVGKDEYYYYQKKVLPGEKTETVFDNIVIKNTIKKENMIPFDILVYEESVQAEGFLSPEEAFAEL